MPIPAIAAISAAAGLGSAVIGARASNRASNAQTDSANQQIGLQADMFNRMDDVQRRLYGAQRDTIQSNTAGAQRTAGNAYDVAAGQARNLRDAGLTNATDTRNQNAGINRNALRASSARTRDNQFDTIRDNNATYGRGMGLSRQTMNENIGDFRRERAAGTEQLWQDRNANIGDARRERAAGTQQLWKDRNANLDTYGKEKAASLGYFEPSIGRGNDAGAAYSYNLGIGNKPSNYSGLQESEGTKYLMNTGRQEIEGGAAGNGNMYSGATLAALDKKRMGLASLDKDNQMQQLMAQAGLGQSAANSAAGIRAGYADDAAATRNGATAGINALRGVYTGQIAGARNAATSGINTLRSQYTGDIADERGDYRNTANLLDQTRGAGNTAARNLGTGTLNQLQDVYANRGIGINNDFNKNSYAINQDLANSMTNASDTLARRRTDAFNSNTANLGAARANRANLMGGNAANYTSGTSAAIANRGDAQAAGTIGGANALMGGLQNGLGMYGMMGGQFGQQQQPQVPQVPNSGTNVFANNNPFANPFANFGSWFK
jgi:hypothetical protein